MVNGGRAEESNVARWVCVSVAALLVQPDVSEQVCRCGVCDRGQVRQE